MLQSVRKSRLARCLCGLGAGLLLLPVHALGQVSLSSCGELLQKADRLERAAAGIDATALEMQADQSASEWHADIATYAEYANMAKASVDAACGVAGGRAGPLGAACAGWQAGTDIGDNLYAAQRFLEGSSSEAMVAACNSLAGVSAGRCSQAEGIAKVVDGDAVEGTLDFAQGSGAFVTDLIDQHGDAMDKIGDRAGRDNARAVARTGRAGLAVAGAAREINSSIGAIRTIEDDSAERRRLSAGLVSGAQGQAKALREMAAGLRVQQCEPDNVDSKIADAFEGLDFLQMDTATESGQLMSTVTTSANLFDERSREISQNHWNEAQSINKSAIQSYNQAALQSSLMNGLQQSAASSNSEYCQKTAAQIAAIDTSISQNSRYSSVSSQHAAMVEAEKQTRAGNQEWYNNNCR